MNRKEYDKIIDECKKISIEKNKAYSNAPLVQHGSYGIFVRISDKFWRMDTLLKNKIKSAESIEDTAKDMINYLVYLVMNERKRLD